MASLGRLSFSVCVANRPRTLCVLSDEKTGRTGRTSLRRYRTFQCGIRIFQYHNRSTARLLSFCVEGLPHRLNYELPPLRSGSSLTRLFQCHTQECGGTMRKPAPRTSYYWAVSFAGDILRLRPEVGLRSCLLRGPVIILNCPLDAWCCFL